MGEPADTFPPLDLRLAKAWAEPWPAARLRKLRAAAADARETFVAAGPVKACATRKLVTFPYPTQYAFSGAALSPAPFVMMTNRMQVLQFEHQGQLKTLLFNPSDVERNLAAPFFARLNAQFGGPIANRLIATRFGTVLGHLEQLGLTPDDVDYLAYDHLHVQDVRGWLGSAGAAFPRAKLLVQTAEWETTRDLHPMNSVWYVPGGADIDASRVVQFEGSIQLGRGVAIVATPGHTLGNMSLWVMTPNGPFITSENGVATESYAPSKSEIPGLARTAERMGYEVLLNGNTREASLDQYSSMVVEKTLAGPSGVNADFPAFCPSSELTSSLLAPGLSPGYSHQPTDVGTLSPTRRS